MCAFFWYQRDPKNYINDASLQHKDKIKLMSKKWSTLSEEEKGPYNEQSNKDKTRYKKENDIYLG